MSGTGYIGAVVWWQVAGGTLRRAPFIKRLTDLGYRTTEITHSVNRAIIRAIKRHTGVQFVLRTPLPEGAIQYTVVDRSDDGRGVITQYDFTYWKDSGTLWGHNVPAELKAKITRSVREATEGVDNAEFSALISRALLDDAVSISLRPYCGVYFVPAAMMHTANALLEAAAAEAAEQGGVQLLVSAVTLDASPHNVRCIAQVVNARLLREIGYQRVRVTKSLLSKRPDAQWYRARKIDDTLRRRIDVYESALGIVLSAPRDALNATLRIANEHAVAVKLERLFNRRAQDGGSGYDRLLTTRKKRRSVRRTKSGAKRKAAARVRSAHSAV